MNTEKVIMELKSQYPQGKIVKNLNHQKVVTEIVCELESEPGRSRAIAVVDSSTLHYHKKITETYKILKGSLTVLKYDKLAVEYKEFELNEGDEIVLHPGEIHSNIGDETWFEVISTPAWTPDDYLELETLFKKYSK